MRIQAWRIGIHATRRRFVPSAFCFLFSQCAFLDDDLRLATASGIQIRAVRLSPHFDLEILETDETIFTVVANT